MGRIAELKRDIVRLVEATGLTIPTRDQHYARNTNAGEQRPDISYFEVITARTAGNDFFYRLESDTKSAFHQLPGHGENPANNSNTRNSKWVETSNGTQEYVFKYSGNAMTGQFALMIDRLTTVSADVRIVRDDKNLGTYNFIGADQSPTGHTAVDIFPWLEWGNTQYDSEQWTSFDRYTAFGKSLGLFVKNTVTGVVDNIEEAILEQVSEQEKIFKFFGLQTPDLFAGNDNAQEFRAKQGEDTVSYATAPGGVTASLERGQGFDGWARNDRYYNVENLTGSAWGDILVGDAEANRLIGGAGADILSGKRGDDYIDGGAGANVLYGNQGDDTFVVNNTATQVIGGSGEDVILTDISIFSVDTALYKNVEVYRQSETITQSTTYLQASSNSETLVGNSSTNYLYGYRGDDVLIGLGGNDGLQGGRGDDTYVFQADWGRDSITEQSGRDTLEFLDHTLDELRITRDIGVNGGFLKVYSKTSDDAVFVWNHFTNDKARVDKLVAKDGEVDLRRGLEMEGTGGSDQIQGSKYGDYLRGLAGVDTFYANAGDDFIEGGSGGDNLYGGEGNDTYVFRPGFGHDRISEEGRYPFEQDSSGDVVALYGINPAQVEIETDTQGRQTIRVLDALGATTDSIFIWAQTSNYGDGRLVEWIQFDDGALMPLIDTI